MPVNRIPLLISMVYGIAVVLCAMVWTGALPVVAAVGGMVVGLAWVFLRPEAGLGRQRDRSRYRG